MPLGNPQYLYLVAANIGAVIMPWMVFYQQSAIADKKLLPSHYSHARWDTALGAIIAQAVMAAVLIASAATVGKTGTHASLESVGDITRVLVPVLGPEMGRYVFGLGTIGAAMVAAIVVSLACAWGFGEVAGYRHSLEHHPLEAPWFYGIYTVAVIGGAVVVDVVPNLVALNIGVEVMNALMLPMVLGFPGPVGRSKRCRTGADPKASTRGSSSASRSSRPGSAYMAEFQVHIFFEGFTGHMTRARGGAPKVCSAATKLDAPALRSNTNGLPCRLQRCFRRRQASWLTQPMGTEHCVGLRDQPGKLHILGLDAAIVI